MATRRTGHLAVGIGVLASTEHHIIPDEHSTGSTGWFSGCCLPLLNSWGGSPGPTSPISPDGCVVSCYWRSGAGSGAHEGFTEQGVAIAEKVMDRDPSVDPDVALAALFIAADHGDAGDYERMLLGYKSADDPQEERRFLEAVCRFDDSELAERTVGAHARRDDPLQESFWVMARHPRRPRSGTSAWRAIRSRWDDILTEVPHRLIARMLDGIPALSHPESGRATSSRSSPRPRSPREPRRCRNTSSCSAPTSG